MPRKETRIALVMNGGISLAVWMGGVTHELDLIRRASASLDNDVPLAADDDPWRPDDVLEREVYTAWKGLCKTLDCTLKIDVVAGSSAGGLNGTLLATSIAAGAHLPGLREVWGELAALERTKLLRKPSAVHDSVLDGDFLRSELAGLIKSIKPRIQPAAVSLFVTATAVRAGGRQWSDSSGRAFTVADHRRLYRFRRRPIWELDADRQQVSPAQELNEFQGVDELVAATRASAGFPVAFAPIPEWSEEYDLRALRHPRIGEPRAEARDSITWLMDGGVLDNAPFGPVLEEVSQQNVDAPWRRVVVYVVPSGDPAPRPQHPLGDAEPPWTTAIGATMWFPREVDVRGDIEQVEELLQRTARWVQAPDALFNRMMLGDGDGSAADAVTSMSEAATALSDQYRQSRTRAGILDALNASRGGDPIVRLLAQPEVGVGAVEDSNWVPPAGNGEQAMTSRGLEPWCWGTAVADRVLRLLLRHLAFAAERVDRVACTKAIDEVGDLVQKCVGLRSAIEVEVASRMKAARAGSEHDRQEAARDAIEYALRVCNAPAILSRLMRQAAEAYRTALGLPLDGDLVLSRALMVEVVTRAFADRERFDRPVDFEFRRFGPDCATDLFRIGRRSPIALGDWKLWGTHFGHFGAFGAARWRQWDWRWGRLDGAQHLFDLLTSELDQAARQDLHPQLDKLLRAILACEKEGPDVESTRRAMETTLKDELWEYRDRDHDLLIRSCKNDPEIRRATNETVQATLQLLRHEDPNIPARMRQAGQYISYALWPDRPRDYKPGKFLVRHGLRWFGKKVRNQIYN